MNIKKPTRTDLEVGIATGACIAVAVGLISRELNFFALALGGGIGGALGTIVGAMFRKR